MEQQDKVQRGDAGETGSVPELEDTRVAGATIGRPGASGGPPTQ